MTESQTTDVYIGFGTIVLSLLIIAIGTGSYFYIQGVYPHCGEFYNNVDRMINTSLDGISCQFENIFQMVGAVLSGTGVLGLLYGFVIPIIKAIAR
jgi:hypothetical protein